MLSCEPFFLQKSIPLGILSSQKGPTYLRSSSCKDLSSDVNVILPAPSSITGIGAASSCSTSTQLLQSSNSVPCATSSKSFCSITESQKKVSYLGKLLSFGFVPFAIVLIL